MAVISLALFAFCSIVLARGLFGKDLPWALAFCGGVGIITALMQMLRDVPIHYAGAYLATAVAVVVLFRSAAWSFARQIVAAVRNPPHFPVRAFFALVLATFAVSAIWIAALEPEGSADGLAMHLKIPASMAIHHRFIFDFRRTIWALMPMGGDLAYSVLYIGGGEFGARLLNVFILAVVAVLVYGASKRFVSSSMAILLAAAFVSAPMAMAVTGSLMVDNFGTAFLVACISAVCLYHERGTARLFLLSSFLIGVGVAFKIGVVPMAAVMAGFLISAAIRHAKTGTALNWRVYSGAAALFLVAALWTYLAAWIQSGSPVYPWALGPLKPFNIPAAGPDGRFMQPLRLNTLYKLTFYTSLYCESLPKGFGFQYLLLVPLAVVAAFGSRSWGFRLALVSGLVGALVILKTAPNARYLYPVTAVLTVAFAGTLAFIRKQDRALYRLCSLCLLATVFLNLVCFATATWEHKEFYTPPLFSASSRKLNMRIHEPQREIITYLNRIDPVHAVFVAKNDLDAELVAPVFDRTWHDPVFGAQLTRATTPLDMYRLLRQLRVAHVIAPRVEANDKDVLQPVRDLLKTCGTEEFHNRDYASFRMSDDCESRLTAAVEK